MFGNQMIDENKLLPKPCPFCGESAELDFAGKSFTYTDKGGDLAFSGWMYTVKCTDELCGCHIGVFEEPMMAVAAWNRRAANG